MANIYEGSHCYNVYYGADGRCACNVCADSESEAVQKFKTLVDAGKNGATVTKVVKIR